jgi:hypothetical protein
MRREVAGIGLGMAAGAVQKDERLALTRLDDARPDTAGIVIGLLDVETHQFEPDRPHDQLRDNGLTICANAGVLVKSLLRRMAAPPATVRAAEARKSIDTMNGQTIPIVLD